MPDPAHAPYAEATVTRMYLQAGVLEASQPRQTVPSAAMDETEAKFELLKVEMASIQAGIRGADTILIQIKGWCVTLSVALVGIVLSGQSARLLIVGAGAAVGFWLIEAQYRPIQRVFIDRDIAIETALTQTDPLEALNVGALTTPRPASSLVAGMALRLRLKSLKREAFLPLTFGVYLLIVALEAILGIVLFISRIAAS